MTVMNDDVITIVADGGSRGNHQKEEPREAYGSFKVFYKGQERRHCTFDFGDMTNVEAEWNTCNEVVSYLEDKMQYNKVNGRDFPKVVVLFDNRQIVDTMMGKMKIKANHLKPFAKLREWMKGKEEVVRFVRIPDYDIKEILGH